MTGRVVRLAATALLAAAVLAPAAHARPVPATSLIGQSGFGDSRNGYAWSMAWFKGKLYVGTGRQVACVENITVDFFLRVSNRYVPRPLPGTRCPQDPYDMDLRAEIWRYTPQTGAWQRVYRAKADLKNPRARGKTVARDIAFRGMTVYRDGKGRKTLYIGGVTADEYLPELKRSHPPRILATRDGRHFRAISAKDVVVRVPYGDFRPMGFRSMRVWRGRLYVTATPGLTGDGAIFEVKRPWSGRPRFKQITPKRLAVFETEVFDGHLYAGTGDREDGYGVYRIGAKRRGYPLHPVITGGAGRGQLATSVVSMEVFKRHLYVGSSGWYNEEELPISELVRIDGKGRWQVVSGAPRAVGDDMKRPISGYTDGFGNLFAAHFWRMVEYHGALYVGTNDWSWVVLTALPSVEPWLQAAIQGALAPEMGFDLWTSCNGRDWYPLTRDAFGANSFDFGARNLVTSPQALYIGSANHAQGTKIWRTTVSPCDGLTSADRAVPEAPEGVSGDAGRRGTVVSWEPAAHAASYRVLRADVQSVPIALAAPPLLPNGFRLPDQAPTVVPAGTPGTAQLRVPVMGRFEEIATTQSTELLDPAAQPGDAYAYQVVAQSPSGESSPPSPVTVVGADGTTAGLSPPAPAPPAASAPAPAPAPASPAPAPPAAPAPDPDQPAAPTDRPWRDDDGWRRPHRRPSGGGDGGDGTATPGTDGTSSSADGADGR